MNVKSYYLIFLLLSFSISLSFGQTCHFDDPHLQGGEVSRAKRKCKAGELHGENISVKSAEAEYKGGFKRGLLSGEGKYILYGKYEYKGLFDAGKFHGEGEIKYLDTKDFYKGQWSKGKKNGQGEYRYADGTVYSGEFFNDKREGKGILKNKKIEYDGEWKADKKNGYGIYSEKKGIKYEGNWSDDKYHGKGRLEYANGDVYEGHFSNNKPDGFGEFTSKNNAVYYKGNYKNGNYNGKGFLKKITKSGRLNEELSYEGTFFKGTFHGKGRLKLISQKGKRSKETIYDGEFKKGKKEGMGVLSYSGTKREQAFSYKGEFKNDKINGYGVYIWYETMRRTKTKKESSTYRGYFKNGLPDGYGIRSYKDGTTSKIGRFKAGKFVEKISKEKVLAELAEHEKFKKSDDEQENRSEERKVSETSTNRQKITEMAKELIGSRRCSGGSGPKCFDCSGFSKYVYQEAAGIEIPRTSRDQFSVSQGRKINKTELKPGDLLFFDTNKRDGRNRVTHVGIYVGNNTMVHSSSSEMKVVEVDISEGYYKENFVGAKKFLGDEDLPKKNSPPERKKKKRNNKLLYGKASYYADKFNGRNTASGETFDNNKYTAAHRELPFGTMVEVTNLKNKRSVIVKINDRGPFSKDRIIDLSKKAASDLDFIRDGVVKVSVRVIEQKK